jgi:uncharacterized protein
MNIQVSVREREPAAASPGLVIADCDIHPSLKSLKDLYPFLEARWRRHLDTYGLIPRQGFSSGPAYPKGQPDACRRDAYPPSGGKPGSDLAFMQAQHLDPNHVELGILNPLRTGQGMQNCDLSTACCRATNDWQVAEWTSKDGRLKASVVVHYEDAPAAAAEIERRSGDANFAQVLLLSRTAEPLGQRRYWPIYAAAVAASLPVGVHAFGYGGVPMTGGGWPSYYIEEMAGHAGCAQSLLTSLVFEGVLERFPALKVVIIEAGFSWLPSLAWRLDRLYDRMRDETPHLRRRPSEYLREQVWLTTQPMEEPEPRKHLLDTIGWIGWDRLLFATDYPHWDFDDPARALPLPLSDAQRRGVFLDNAKAVYGLA